MSYLLSKVFAIFFFPVPLLFWVLLYLIVRNLREGRRARWLTLWLIAAVVSTPVASSWLLSGLESSFQRPSIEVLKQGKRQVNSEKPVKKPQFSSTTVIVLGGMVDVLRMANGSIPEFNEGADRFIHGILLARKIDADYLLFTGGAGLMGAREKGHSPVDMRLSEGRMLQQFFEKNRFLSDVKLLFEKKSRNTHENAVYSFDYLSKVLPEKDRIHGRFIVVTSAFHMHRSIGCFKKAGFKNLVAYPVDYRAVSEPVFPESWVPSLRGINTLTITLKEYIGIWVYRISGYI